MKFFALLKLRLLPGEDEEYELTFQTAANQSKLLAGRLRATRSKTASLLAKLGIEDSKATVFEAGSLGATARHISIDSNVVHYLQELLEKKRLEG